MTRGACINTINQTLNLRTGEIDAIMLRLVADLTIVKVHRRYRILQSINIAILIRY